MNAGQDDCWSSLSLMKRWIVLKVVLPS
uniref:Uncharacterized protein n=1 Tax=Anguilla anguilla TaxID=7936 RepID=A0A0E9UAK0_ANGAN